MISSAPDSRAIWAFSAVDTVPRTRAPMFLAICTINPPAPPAAYQQLAPQKAIPEQQLATQQATVHQDEGVVKLDAGIIESAKVNLAYCKIAAPVTGRVGLRLVDLGNIVHAADTNGLVVITQMDPISAIFTISEDQLQVVLQKMAAGQTLQVDAYDRDGKTKLAQGSLTTLDNQIDPTTGTLKLRATFRNPKGTL